MRLIDADELKKKFQERSYWTYTHEYGDAIPIGWIMSGIDNAPTVELFCSYLSDGEVRQPCVEAPCTHERTQGEWIDYSEEGFVECPFCHKATTCEDNIDELHYCWNCGAKLGKGGEEE